MGTLIMRKAIVSTYTAARRTNVAAQRMIGAISDKLTVKDLVIKDIW
jgi:hypothetical protein